MNASQSQNTLSERNKLSQSFSTSSLPSAPRVNDPAYNSLSGVEQLTGKGQLFHGLNSFQQYCSQDSVQSGESSLTDRKQRSDDGDSCEGDSELTADDNRASSEGEQEESFRQYDGSNEDKETFQLSMTIKELIDTECVYVKDLRDVVFGYMQKIQRLGSVTSEDLRDLFGNIRAIYEFNRQFLSHLQKNVGEPVNIASCFVDHYDDFIIYSDYCTNYPRSLKVLELLMKDQKFVSALREEQMRLQHPLPFETYLFKPVQRILKYHLLLKSMQTNHSDDAHGHDIVEAAVDRMVAIAMYINEMKRRHERMLRTQELQNMLNGAQNVELVAYGDLVLEDLFRLIGTWGDRHVLLFCHAIVITKKRKDGSLQIKLIIKISNLMLIESISREPLQFQIFAFDLPKMRYALQAKTLEQKQIWCQEIKRLMMENFPANIPERAKQVVLGTPNVEPNSAVNDLRQPSAFVRRNYKSLTPERKAEQRVRRRSTGAMPKEKDSSDTLMGLADSSLDEETAGRDDTLPSDSEDVQDETSVQDEPACVGNRRSQSVDSLNDNETGSDTVSNSAAVINKEESSESEVDDVRPTADSSCSDASSGIDDSSQKVRFIPIRANSFKQAMQVEPIDCNRKQRVSTLEDVFEDDVNSDNTRVGQEPSSISRPSVTMRRSGKSSRSSASSASPEYRNKRLSRLFDDWDPSILASVSTMQELFKSWPSFDDSPDVAVTGRIIPIQRAQSNGPAMKRDDNQNALPVFSSLNHSVSNCSSRPHRLCSVEPTTMSNSTNKSLQTRRQTSMPVVQLLSNNASVAKTSHSSATSYSVPVRVISSQNPSISSGNDVPLLFSVNSIASNTVGSGSSSSSSCASTNSCRNIPVKVVQSGASVYNVPVLHSSLSINKCFAAGDGQTPKMSVGLGTAGVKVNVIRSTNSGERVIPITHSQPVTVRQSNGRNDGCQTDQCGEHPTNLSSESVCDEEFDEDPLKKMLQEMTVKHQSIRETVQKMNLKTSRSVDNLDGGSARPKLVTQPAVSSYDIHNSKSKSAAVVVVNPVAGDLIKKRITMFEGENG